MDGVALFELYSPVVELFDVLFVPVTVRGVEYSLPPDDWFGVLPDGESGDESVLCEVVPVAELLLGALDAPALLTAPVELVGSANPNQSIEAVDEGRDRSSKGSIKRRPLGWLINIPAGGS